MSLLDSLGALAKAQKAIDEAQSIRREKVEASLLAFAAEARAVPSGDLPDVVRRHLPDVLKASSQGSAVREISRAFGVGDMLKGLIDRLDGKD